MTSYLIKAWTAFFVSDNDEEYELFATAYNMGPDPGRIDVDAIAEFRAASGVVGILVDRLANLEGEDRATIWREVLEALPPEPTDS